MVAKKTSVEETVKCACIEIIVNVDMLYQQGNEFVDVEKTMTVASILFVPNKAIA